MPSGGLPCPLQGSPGRLCVWFGDLIGTTRFTGGP
jgi:hypothetical protein